MKDFLAALLDDGRVTVPPAGIPMEWTVECDTLLPEFDRRARAHMAHLPPPLDRNAAQWAAILLAEICRLTLCRDASVEEIEKVVSVPCPAPPVEPSVAYSVDLFLRQLPGVFRWVERLAAGDPLLERIRTLGESWPLSSVGMPVVSVGSIDAIVASKSLMALYVDRILAARDRGRLLPESVQQAVRAALGGFPQLAAEMAAALKEVSEKAASC